MSLGLSSGTLRLAAADPAWPALFVAERARVLATVGSLPLALEHIGSTAVPGLAAKPILDLLGGRPAGSALALYVTVLEEAGYRHRGEYGIPGRHYFVRDDAEGRRTHHLHLVEDASVFWREHLAFRDALRADLALRDAYAALKRDLAARFLHDREAYTEGKTAFIRQAVARSLAEAPAAAGAAPARRILVIGSGGAGKSTLATQLAARLGLPVVHLDARYWRPGWVATPEPEWRETVADLASQDAWVMDGNYGGTLDLRLAACDAVIFLDLPRALCVVRVLRRWLRYAGRPRPDMAPGCPEQVTWEFLRWVWAYPRTRRPGVLRRLAALPPDRRVTVLRSRADVARFLAGLSAGPPRPAAGAPRA